MKNYFITFCFDGTNYYGTQKQSKLPSVTQTFEDVLKTIYLEDIKFLCCSRLDRGVHGLFLGGNFLTDSEKIDVGNMVYTFNRLLPSDIRVLSASIVAEDFSSRYDAVRKTYLYRINTSEVCSPFLIKYCYHSFLKIDFNKLENVKKLFIGEHDFYSFSTEDEDKNTVNTIESIDIIKEDDNISIRISGRKFLRYQIRYIVGAMLEFAYNKISMEDIIYRLNNRDRKSKRFKVEAKGLFLENVEFDFKRSLNAEI